MHFTRRPRDAARATLSARLRLEELETRETPAVISGFQESVFASGLTAPTSMAVAPDGRIFVAERGGNLRIVQNGSVLGTPFVTVNVNASNLRGLLGVTLDPNFSSDGFVYVFYTTNAATPVNRVSRFTANPGNPNTALLLSEVVLVDNIAATSGSDNGGALQFGADGKLYVGTGDAGTPSNAQNLSSLSGKILRVNPNDGSAPTDNPFVSVTGARPEVWAYGLHNPLTMAFLPGTNLPYINDIGQNSFEEIDSGIGGSNFGWPQTEGFTPAGVSGVTYPLYAYSHGTGPFQGGAIAGGAFYNPSSPSFPSFPSKYRGDYFFGDFITGRIFVRDSVTGTVSTFASSTKNGGVVNLAVLPDGRLLYLSYTTGTINQIAASNLGPGVRIAGGTGVGVPPALTVFNPSIGLQVTLPVIPSYRDVRVATGDLTGDGVADIVAVSGPGGPPLVSVYDGTTGQIVAIFYAFDPSFTGGLNVAIGDVNGDGRDDLIISTASGGSTVEVVDPVVRQIVSTYNVFPGFVGGVTVAVGDVDGDGRGDIIIGTATGTSFVTVYSPTLGKTILSFFAFDLSYTGGVNVGFANGDIITGTASGPAAIRTFDSTGQSKLLFLVAVPPDLSGVRVAGEGDLILAGVGPTLFGFDRNTGMLIGSLPAFPTLQRSGNVSIA